MRPVSRYLTRAACFGLLALMAGGLAAAQVSPALAAPANDNFASATPVSSLPFADSGDLNGATTEPGEPQTCNSQAQTVWYKFTPSAGMVVNADLDGSDFGVVFNVYQSFGNDFAGLQFLGCIGFGGAFNLSAQARSTYYFQVGSVSVGTANFQFHVAQIPPPPNDDFVNATQITSVPFSDAVQHLIAATRESNDPVPCAGGNQPSTVWWSFTPSVSGSYSANFPGPLSPSLAVYTGSSLASLQLVACNSVQNITFQATAGTTYHILAGGMFSLDFPMTFSLDVTPPPSASFFFFPFDPSIFDTVQFFDTSFDPAGVGIQSEAWMFGDGAQATGCCPTHQYAKDGDYIAGLTVTTRDGRTASAAQVVHVSTHDVIVVRIGVPRAAHVQQTIAINVSVRDTRQPETVQVDLLKSGPSGFQQVGSLTQFVPVDPGHSTTLFAFTNTMTEADQSVGTVSFEAVATIVGHRDALPANNVLISLPITVS